MFDNKTPTVIPPRFGCVRSRVNVAGERMPQKVQRAITLQPVRANGPMMCRLCRKCGNVVNKIGSIVQRALLFARLARRRHSTVVAHVQLSLIAADLSFQRVSKCPMRAPVQTHVFVQCGDIGHRPADLRAILGG